MTTPRALVVLPAGLLLLTSAFAGAPPSSERNFSFTAMHTGAGHVDRMPGSVASDTFTIAHDFSHLLSLGLFQGGMEWSDLRIDRSAALPLPAHLHTIAVHFGGVSQLRPGLQPILRLTPSLSADTYKFSSPNLNLNVVLALRREFSPGSSLTLGLNARVHAEDNWVPVVSYVRTLSPAWTLDLGFPSSSLAFNWSDALKWKLSAEIDSTAWHITRGAGALNNSYLEYREIRYALGATYTVNGVVSIAAGTGLSTGRRFSYYERGLRLKPDAAGFIRVSAKAKF